jgi:hypothetical protein
MGSRGISSSEASEAVVGFRYHESEPIGGNVEVVVLFVAEEHRTKRISQFCKEEIVVRGKSSKQKLPAMRQRGV